MAVNLAISCRASLKINWNKQVQVQEGKQLYIKQTTANEVVECNIKYG